MLFRLCLISTFVTGVQASWWSSTCSWLKEHIYCSILDCRSPEQKLLDVWKSLETERKQMEESRKAVDFAKIPMKDYAMLMSHDSAMGYRTEASKFRTMVVLCPPRVDHPGWSCGGPHPVPLFICGDILRPLRARAYGESFHHRFVSRDSTTSEHTPHSHIAKLLYHSRYCRIRSCPRLDEPYRSVPEHDRTDL